MEISEIRVVPRHDRQLRGFASITLNNCFVVRGLKIIQGSKRMFVAMPSQRNANGEFVDVAHPIDESTRKYLEDSIIAAYEKLVAEGPDLEPEPDPPAPITACGALPVPVIQIKAHLDRKQ